jgi:hypothetical protein
VLRGGAEPAQWGGANIVDEVVVLGLGGGEPAVVGEITDDLLGLVAGVLGNEVDDPLGGAAQFLGTVSRGRGGDSVGVGRQMQHHPGVRQDEAFPWGACCEKKLAHGCAETQADGDDIVLDVLHGVVDRQIGRHQPARRVDAERDVVVRLGGQEQEPGSNTVDG